MKRRSLSIFAAPVTGSLSKKSVLVASLCVAISGSLTAHEEALESGWCSGGQVSILGHFTLNKSLLLKFKGEQNLVCDQIRSCGQFDDDDYSVAFRAAGGICQSFSEAELLLRTVDDHETVRAIIHAPATMKNVETNHHDIYQLDQGIEFSCGYCTMPAIEDPVEEPAESVVDEAASEQSERR